MKKLIFSMLIAVLACVFCIPAAAATEPEIVRQIQNSTFTEYDVATYEIKAYGYNLYCTWYMEFEGNVYNISDTSVGIQPWEPYAGETYGALTPEVNGAFSTFRYVFRGIGPELDGAKIYAVITDGTHEITSQKAHIRVVDGVGKPPQIIVVSEMVVYEGEMLSLYCQATDPLGGTLSYLWYETPNGELENIIAVNRGAETTDTLAVDTSSYGVYYYVCGVDTSNGGSAYSSVIKVTVLEKTEIQVQYTQDSFSVVGHAMTVDIETMRDEDARIWNAFLEKDVQYQWYRDGQAISGANSQSLEMKDEYEGSVIHVVVTCYDLVIRGVGFQVTSEEPPFGISTEALPGGTVGESYSAKIEANDPDAFFEDWAVGTQGTTLQSLGLSISADGMITGTPTAAGSYNITIHASCAAGEDQKFYTLIIADAQSADPSQPTEPGDTGNPTLPSQPESDDGDPSNEGDPSDEGMPGWGYAVIAVIALGIGVAVVLILKKK